MKKLNIKKGLLGFGIGFGATLLLYNATQPKKMSSQQLTEKIIHATPNGGKIIGTWLCSVEENNPAISEKPFIRGGVTVEKNYERSRYTFIIEPIHGEILSVEQTL